MSCFTMLDSPSASVAGRNQPRHGQQYVIYDVPILLLHICNGPPAEFCCCRLPLSFSCALHRDRRLGRAAGQNISLYIMILPEAMLAQAEGEKKMFYTVWPTGAIPFEHFASCPGMLSTLLPSGLRRLEQVEGRHAQLPLLGG